MGKKCDKRKTFINVKLRSEGKRKKKTWDGKQKVK